jgi:hypothetical protein
MYVLDDKSMQLYSIKPKEEDYFEELATIEELYRNDRREQGLDPTGSG